MIASSNDSEEVEIPYKKSVLFGVYCFRRQGKSICRP